MEPSLYGYSLEDFREEAKDLLARAEEALAEIARSPGDIEKVNALFRVIHSLKGSAAYAGLTDVNTFAHLYEGFLGDLRNKRHEVNQEAINILVRARDYLEDLITQPECVDVINTDETAGSPMEQLAAALKGIKVLNESWNIRPLSPPLGNTGLEPPAKAEIPVKKSPREQKKISLSTQYPTQMGQKDVIKVTITSTLKTIFEYLKNPSPDRDMLLKALKKLDDSSLWAFGESAGVVKPLEKMKEIASGDLGAKEISSLRKAFNSLTSALKEELSALDGPKKIREADEKKKVPADEIRGASMDDIVKITLTKALDTLSELITADSPPIPQIERVINRLKDLNRWAFDDDGGIKAHLRVMEEILKRPYGEDAAQEMRAISRTIRPIFISLLEEKEGPYSEEGREQAATVHELPLQGRERREAVSRRITAPSPGSTLRVRSEDLESLISTVGEMNGLEAKDFERLQAQTLQLRMVPLGELFSRFRKVVRDLSEELGKEIELEISGESTRIDKVIADKLIEPLMHMVRNAASHGLESPEERRSTGKGKGMIRLSAYQEGGHIVIEVSDNGRGISLEKVRKRGIEMGLIKEDEGTTDKAVLDLIFAPGFSTKEGADRVSGRGVGMDVVREVVSSLQGGISTETREGTGTTFRLFLPLTLAIIKAMILEQGGNKIAIPAASVDKVVTMTDEELNAGIVTDNNRPSIDLAGEGEVVPLINLSNIFGLESRSGNRCVVLAKAGIGHKVALVVDSALGRQPLMVKPLDRFAENRYFSSASFVDNDVIMILNTAGLMAA